MLQALREKTSGLIAKIILGAIVIAFSFFGIESYFIAQTDTFVARVEDKEISQQDFRTRFDEFRQRQLQQANGAIDASFFERPELKRQLLEQMIDEQVLLVANEKLGVVVPADRLREEILKIPAFQRDGRFDDAQYRAVLASQGMTPVSFQERYVREIASGEIPREVASSAFVTDADVDAYLRLNGQLRDFNTLTLARPVATDLVVSDEEIGTYYTGHQQEFMNPEQVSLEYVELDAATIDVELTPDEATLKDRYEKEKARFVSTEQRLASHILVKVGGKGGPDEQKAALDKATRIAADAKSGKAFAELAKQSSDDLGSKALGGDLGWLDKGMTDPAFEAALYALEKGKVSDPVLSGEGYHVIELRDVRPGKTRGFDEVRAELVKEYTESEHERVYNQKSSRLIDLAYQDSSSLEAAARELGVSVQKTALFTRDGGLGLAANPAVVRAAFSDAVLVQGNNSDSIDLGPNHVAIIRIGEHKPATPRPLDEVRGSIRERILGTRIAAQAKERAEGLLARLKAGESLAKLAGELKLEAKQERAIGRSAVNVDSTLLTAVFGLPRVTEGKPAHTLVALPNDEYALVELEKTVDADPAKLEAPTREAARNTLQQTLGYATVRDFVAALRAGMDVKVAEERM
jgi:peptidyl-prolyl cis-trans isomerase D